MFKGFRLVAVMAHFSVPYRGLEESLGGRENPVDNSPVIVRKFVRAERGIEGFPEGFRESG